MVTQSLQQCNTISCHSDSGNHATAYKKKYTEICTPPPKKKQKNTKVIEVLS
jgi:hypothetical protein